MKLYLNDNNQHELMILDEHMNLLTIDIEQDFKVKEILKVSDLLDTI
jgi:hypothetical protein